jgi:hypothetical protein
MRHAALRRRNREHTRARVGAPLPPSPRVVVCTSAGCVTRDSIRMARLTVPSRSSAEAPVAEAEK